MGPDRGNMGGVSTLQCSFLQETDKYLGLCEQERYCDEAPMRWLPKGSASCHALILRDAEESLYRRFGSLFGLGVAYLKKIKKIPENAFQECFKSWKKRMHKCLRVEGDYFEGL